MIGYKKIEDVEERINSLIFEFYSYCFMNMQKEKNKERYIIIVNVEERFKPKVLFKECLAKIYVYTPIHLIFRRTDGREYVYILGRASLNVFTDMHFVDKGFSFLVDYCKKEKEKEKKNKLLLKERIESIIKKYVNVFNMYWDRDYITCRVVMNSDDNISIHKMLIDWYEMEYSYKRKFNIQRDYDGSLFKELNEIAVEKDIKVCFYLNNKDDELYTPFYLFQHIIKKENKCGYSKKIEEEDLVGVKYKFEKESNKLVDIMYHEVVDGLKKQLPFVSDSLKVIVKELIKVYLKNLGPSKRIKN